MKAKNSFVWRHRIEILFATVALAVIHVILVAKWMRPGRIDIAKAGEFGDFVGGYLGTILAVVGVVALIKTFRSEREAEAEDAFEDRYIELIKLHRRNVEELSLGKATGRKVFVWLLREWREVLSIVRQAAIETDVQLTQRQLLSISYTCFYYGTGPNSTRMMYAALRDLEPKFAECLIKWLSSDYVKDKVQAKRNFPYKPLEGHQSRLGHYYRHLFQLVSYVHAQKINIDKYGHVKTIRAQLSTHEQAMLLLNSFSPMGSPWWSDGLIKTYKLVQNLPKDFFIEGFELKPEDLFDDKEYFEWQTAVLANIEKLNVPMRSEVADYELRFGRR